MTTATCSAQDTIWTKSVGTNIWGSTLNWSNGKPDANKNVYYNMTTNGTSRVQTSRSARDIFVSSSYPTDVGMVDVDLAIDAGVTLSARRLRVSGFDVSDIGQIDLRGNGELSLSDSISIYQQGFIKLHDSMTVTATSLSGNSNGGASRDWELNDSSSLTVNSIDLGEYGGDDFSINDTAILNSISAILRSGDFGSNASNVEVNHVWSNSGNIQIGQYSALDSTPNKTALLRVDGAGQLMSDSIVVGQSGTFSNVVGRLEIEGGGQVTTNDLTLLDNGQVKIGNGTLTIDGGVFTESVSDFHIRGGAGSEHAQIALKNGASWTTVNNLTVARATSGSLSIESGSTVNVANALILGRSNGIATGTVSVDGTDSILTVGDTATVGTFESGELNVSSGGMVLATAVTIGRYGSSDGTAEVVGSGADASRLSATETITVGDAGVGNLYVRNGANATSGRGVIGAGGRGTVTVSGASSRWHLSRSGSATATNGNLTIGQSGNGALSILDGGVVSNHIGMIASASGSTGVVTVDGNGSTWNNSDDLQVGAASGGNGTLNIQNSGLVKVDQAMTVFNNGTVNLDGGTLNAKSIGLEAGSDFNFDDGTLIVDNFAGNLTQNGGVLSPGDSPGLTTITGDYNLNAGSVLFELDGLVRGTGYDALDITGDAFLNGTLDIDLGFTPGLGDSFHLFSMTGGGSITGSPTFDFADATLNSGLAWNTSSFFSTGSISVSAVPEPSSLGLLLAASVVPLRLRRRR